MTNFDSLFADSGSRWNVAPAILEAIARTESSLNPNVTTWEPKVGEYSVGLMGLLQSTAAGLGFAGTLDQLKDPATNIELGAQLAAQIIARQGGFHPESFYSEWNSGNANAWQTSVEVAAHVVNFVNNYDVAMASWYPDAPGAGDTALADVGTPLALGLIVGLFALGKGKR